MNYPVYIIAICVVGLGLATAGQPIKESPPPAVKEHTEKWDFICLRAGVGVTEHQTNVTYGRHITSGEWELRYRSEPYTFYYRAALKETCGLVPPLPKAPTAKPKPNPTKLDLYV